MENVKIIKDYNGVEHAIITNDDESFISMPKSTYEAMQAEQSTPNFTE